MILSPFIASIEEKLKAQTTDQQNKLYKTLDMEFMEKTEYFKLNSMSFANGTIDLETSQFIYNNLKNYENTTLAQRIVITQLMKELLQKRIAKH